MTSYTLPKSYVSKRFEGVYWSESRTPFIGHVFSWTKHFKQREYVVNYIENFLFKELSVGHTGFSNKVLKKLRNQLVNSSNASLENKKYPDVVVLERGFATSEGLGVGILFFSLKDFISYKYIMQLVKHRNLPRNYGLPIESVIIPRELSLEDIRNKLNMS